MYIKFVIIYFLIFNSKSFISVFSLPINNDNQCVTKAGGPGRCATPGKCDAIIKNKIKYTMLNKCKNTRLLCCPTIITPDENIESNKIIPAIINGKSVEPNQYPFMVALGKKSTNSDTIGWKCGGSIISSTFILTAAHCQGITNIVVGTNNLIGIEPAQTINEAEFEFISHEQYIQNGKGNPNDIAIIKLKKDLVFNEAVNSITLASKNMATLPSDATVIGFGSTLMYGRATSKILTQAELQKVSCPGYLKTVNQICYAGYDYQNTKNSQRQGTCRGDSGGPLFVKDSNEQYILIGITSYSSGCVLAPTAFTSIPIFSDWINSHYLNITTTTTT